MARGGDIRKESKGKKSSKDAKQQPQQQYAYTPAQVLYKKKDKEEW